MNFSDPNFVILISLVGAKLILLSWVFYHHLRLNKILKGKGAIDLEDSFQHFENEIKELKKFRSLIEDYLEDSETRLQNSIQGVGIVRFNPWKGTGDGGNQSFALALISEKKNGVVISSLYARDRFSAFTKSIINGKSEYDLTKEEQEALSKALNQINAKKIEK